MDDLKAFADQSGWQDAEWSPVAGDLSSRRYFRLRRDERTAILMDADGDADTVAKFARLTEWLRSIGLSAPEIYASRLPDGLMIIEDFGDLPLTHLVAGGRRDEALDTCLDLLIHIRRAEAPALLERPGAGDLAKWTEIADEFIPNADKEALGRFRSCLETILAPLLESSTSVSLRDFHAENIMWLGQKRGIKRLGLLDYQDAIVTHFVYDLVSLLTDARMDVSQDTRNRWISKYAGISGDDPEELNLAFAAVSAQRNLRIMAMFFRAARLGKQQHLPKIPRVFGYFKSALQHPVFDDVRDATLSALPLEGREQ